MINRKRSILQIIATAQRGGAEKHTRLISKAFRRRGFEVMLVFPPGPYAEEFRGLERIGITCIEFPVRRRPLRAIGFIRGLVRKHGVGYVHSHMHWADFIAACALRPLSGVCHFSTIHFLASDYTNPIVRLSAVAMTRYAFAGMDRIFALSAAAARRARETLGVDGARLTVMLNSIDFDEIRPDNGAVHRLKRELKADGTPLVLCAGLLHRIKGQRYLIEAVSLLRQRYPSLKLVLLGEGNARPELEECIRTHHCTAQVLMPGYRSDIADWMAAADIYVQPSLVDTMPRALLEAMYLGVPVVASRIESLAEVVRHGQTGMCAEPASADSLAAAIAYLLDHPDEARRMGEEAKRFVEQNCSMDVMAERMLNAVGGEGGDV